MWTNLGRGSVKFQYSGEGEARHASESKPSLCLNNTGKRVLPGTHLSSDIYPFFGIEPFAEAPEILAE